MSVPWFVKIPAKMILARSPVPRSLLNRVGIFRHGSMVQPAYAYEIFNRHLQSAGVALPGTTVLELGPGDSVGNGILAWALGAERSILVDAGAWATQSLDVYRRFVHWIRHDLPEAPRAATMSADWPSFEAMLADFGITYLSNGLTSLRSLPAASVNYVFSEAVLEHVRHADVPDTLEELRRIVRPDGVGSHVIDYKDHLQAGLNNMRFSPALWESDLFVRSGFYTNRLRHPDMLSAFGAAGWTVDEVSVTRWDKLPMSLQALYPSFRHYQTDDLLVREAAIVVKPELHSQQP